MPRAIGALVVGYYENGSLVYAGRVGTGYSHATARDIWKRLQPLDIRRLLDRMNKTLIPDAPWTGRFGHMRSPERTSGCRTKGRELAR